MKFLAIAATFAAAAFAASINTEARGYPECSPPSYECKPSNQGWTVAIVRPVPLAHTSMTSRIVFRSYQREEVVSELMDNWGNNDLR
ncbi:hypothetical protein F5Y16DRAFT_404004 [Xylariaceae sp. FL0255]|nr:hypothetical protein F5Y16DRAFT_404004 [Xylariaceae sp. FL0255]